VFAGLLLTVSERFAYPDESTQAQNNMQLEGWRYGKEGKALRGVCFPIADDFQVRY
jgi:hypothetical protein